MKGKELAVVSPPTNHNPHARPGPLPGREQDREHDRDRDRDYDRERDRDYDRERDRDYDRERDRDRDRDRDGGAKKLNMLRDESNQSLPGHSLVQPYPPIHPTPFCHPLQPLPLHPFRPPPSFFSRNISAA